MLIHVMYPDNHYDYVKEFMLDNLLESRNVVKFQRVNGWVSVGVDSMRSDTKQNFYGGVERRKAA